MRIRHTHSWLIHDSWLAFVGVPELASGRCPDLQAEDQVARLEWQHVSKSSVHPDCNDTIKPARGIGRGSFFDFRPERSAGTTQVQTGSSAV